MSRFNSNTQVAKVSNLAGGDAYSENPKLELVSLLLTSFAQDQYYRKADESLAKLRALIAAMPDKQFAAKATVYARIKFGMRSISHAAAVEIMNSARGSSWLRAFLRDVVYRPDDATEILSYWDATYGRNKRTRAMRDGLALAMNKFDAYALAKYRGEGKKIKLVDVFNFAHPEKGKYHEAVALLLSGELKSTDTWEAKLTQAGQKGESDEEKLNLKADAWKELILERKIKYFALLRNLRNIIEQAPGVVPQAAQMLADPELIHKSLVLPFRYLTAIEEIKKINGPEARIMLIALNKAIDSATSNVPKFDGRTLIALDSSGSMQGKPSEIGSLFAAIMVKASNADLLLFSDDANYTQVNPSDSTLTIAGSIPFISGGTNFHAIFERATAAYDRIVILSDMQAWKEQGFGSSVPRESFARYKQRTSADPKIYSFDLQGYGSLQFPERNVHCLAGFSEKVFDIMAMLEHDPKAMITEIEKIEFAAVSPRRKLATA